MRHSRQVLALCALCVVFFLLRGTLNLVSVFGLLPRTTGGMPFMDPVSGEHTEASILFDVVRPVALDPVVQAPSVAPLTRRGHTHTR